MISYKAFESKFICENYLYKVGMNFIRKEIHNTNVFHSVMNPFDCLTYYGDINNFEYLMLEDVLRKIKIVVKLHALSFT